MVTIPADGENRRDGKLDGLAETDWVGEETVIEAAAARGETVDHSISGLHQWAIMGEY